MSRSYHRKAAPQVYHHTLERCHYVRRAGDMYSVLED